MPDTSPCSSFGYREFAAGEAELREFLAVRVWSSLEGPRALFDRAVVWLVNNRVLLPGVTTLARMAAAVRQEENDRLHTTLYEAVPYDLRTEMIRLLEVPEKKRVSELERLRLGPMKVSGKAMQRRPATPSGCWPDESSTSPRRSATSPPGSPPPSLPAGPSFWSTTASAPTPLPHC